MKQKTLHKHLSMLSHLALGGVNPLKTKLALLLCALIVGSGTMWAASYTITFTTGSGDGKEATTSTACSALVSAGANYLSGNLATATKVYYAGSNGLKLGASSSAGTIKMNLASHVTPTSIVVNAKLYNSSKAATLKVNGSTAQSISSSFEDLTFNITSEISFIQLDASKYCWIKSITVNYAAASSGEETTTAIDYTGITNTNVFKGTAAGSLSASVTHGVPATNVPDASVTWSGDDDEVATINASTGAVTLVGAGTVTFKASYAGVEGIYSSSSDTYEMTVTNEDPEIVTIWNENFSNYSANGVPNGGTYGYVCADGNSATKIYEDNLADGVSPELLVAKGGGSFTATIPLLYPTYGYSGNLTLTFKTNNTNIAVSTSTDGVTVTGDIVTGTSTLTLSDVTTSMENVVITFTNSTGSNVRLDDIVLKGKQTELSVVATPTISPASGAVASGTEVTMTCATDGATIYYTTDGSKPTSGSTEYNPASKPTIISACTIKAIGIKDGLTDSEVASASYTIAEPCATPTFSVAAGEVNKGTTVTLSCATDGATIYYTNNGSTPTTSSFEYSGAIAIYTATTIKAIAIKDGYANSEVASATYTVRDYATLPFSYDGNGTGTLPSGLTVSGTGTYDSSPKIKFDGTGDYMILKIGETPGKLSFNIKGNSFSGGTFKVQTSADGESYTDLQAYTSLSNTQSESFNLSGDVRYIKWIYTTKSSGNVALGNINLTKGVPVTITAAKYATFSSGDDVDFSKTGVTVYKAKVDTEKKVVKLTEVPDGIVPANTGVILYKDVDANTDVTVPVTTTDAAISENDLVATVTSTLVKKTEDDKNFNYIMQLSNETIVFNMATVDGAYMPAGKAYLSTTVDASTGNARLSVVFDDETAGIATVNVKKGESDHNAVYNLNGQRLAQPRKGLNIVNGKKMFVK